MAVGGQAGLFGRSSLPTRPGGRAGAQRLAGGCEGDCVTGLSAGRGACWFWVRRSSQSKQVCHPRSSQSPDGLDRLAGRRCAGTVNSCFFSAAECPGLSDTPVLGCGEVAWPGPQLVPGVEESWAVDSGLAHYFPSNPFLCLPYPSRLGSLAGKVTFLGSLLYSPESGLALSFDTPTLFSPSCVSIVC